MSKIEAEVRKIAELASGASTPGAFRLPPLILHPFSNADETALLVESSQASLRLQGFLPKDDTPLEELEARLLRGRRAELRMLFYIGKDVARWAEQCAESAHQSGKFANRKIRTETFVVLLVQHVPTNVKGKLDAWGVVEASKMFRRSYGLHAVFGDLPTPDVLAPEFLRRYHGYLDNWYEQRLKEQFFDYPTAADFVFELYASGEYASMLEKSWSSNSVS